MSDAIAAAVPADPSSPDTPTCPRHGVPAAFTCARCASFGCWSCAVGTPWGSICPACHQGLVAAAGPGAAVPAHFSWETAAAGSRFSAFTATAWSLSMRPSSTWALVPMQGAAGPPLWFAIWANLLESIWWIPGGIAVGAMEGMKDGGNAAKGLAFAAGGCVASLVCVALLSALAALSCPLELLLVRLLGGKAELPQLWRIWCYSQAPGLAGPVTGLLQASCSMPVSGFWGRYCRARGIERYCGLSFGRALAVTFSPLIALFVAAVGFIVVAAFAAGPTR